MRGTRAGQAFSGRGMGASFLQQAVAKIELDGFGQVYSGSATETGYNHSGSGDWTSYVGHERAFGIRLEQQARIDPA